MRRLLTGLFVALLLLLNTLLLIGPLLLCALIKLVASTHWRDRCSAAATAIAETWAQIAQRIFALCTPTHWDIRGAEDLRLDTSYLVVSNHQSWVDIPALIQALNKRVPFFKCFLKKELIWLPLLGQAWWALDYPFMNRYSKALLARHPELRGHDLEITRAACELYKRQPVTVINYLEGTRFTAEKKPGKARLSSTCSSPRPAVWPLYWRPWASSSTRSSTSRWCTPTTAFRASGTCSAGVSHG